MTTVVVATPHKRHDALFVRLCVQLPNSRIERIDSPGALTFEKITELNPRFIFFPHWSWIIPADIYQNYECVIFHMTNLPYGRGGSPLQNLIVRGHTATKLTALKCVAELDAGPIYQKRDLSLEGTAEEILQRATGIMEEMIVDLVKNKPIPASQKGEVIRFSRRKPQDGNIASLETVSKVYDYIRMLDADGYPPAFLDTARLNLEFSDAQLKNGFVEARVRIRSREHREQDVDENGKK